MLPPSTRPSATGSTGCRPPERAKKTSIQATAIAVTTITIEVALPKKPKAIPELRTWWIENGPAICTSSPSASARATTCFVSWSAATAATTIAARPTHWRSPAPSGRSPARIGRRAFVDDPTRTSSGSDVTAGGLVHRASRLASSMQSVVHGTASSRSTGISLPQTSQRPYSPDSIRSSAFSTWRSWSRASSSRPSSSSRSYVSRRRVRQVVVRARRQQLAGLLLERRSCRCRGARSSCSGAREPARAPPGSGRCRCSSGLGLLSARRGEPSLDLVRRDPGQLDDLVPRGAARDERDARARDGRASRRGARGRRRSPSPAPAPRRRAPSTPRRACRRRRAPTRRGRHAAAIWSWAQPRPEG